MVGEEGIEPRPSPYQRDDQPTDLFAHYINFDSNQYHRTFVVDLN